MTVQPTSLPEVLLITPKIHGDHRGFFMELWKEEAYSAHGIRAPFVQDNISSSRKGILRGLHFQNPLPQAKLISVISGEIFDVAVDVRFGSPTFGKSVGVHLDDRMRQQLYIPAGFAHGYQVVSDLATIHYKATAPYRPENERGILWNDPAIGIAWPLADPLLSERDSHALPLGQIAPADLRF